MIVNKNVISATVIAFSFKIKKKTGTARIPPIFKNEPDDDSPN